MHKNISSSAELKQLIKKLASGNSWAKYGSIREFAKDIAMIGLAPVAVSIASTVWIMSNFIDLARRDKLALPSASVQLVFALCCVVLTTLSPLIRTSNIIARSFFPKKLSNIPIANEDTGDL